MTERQPFKHKTLEHRNPDNTILADNHAGQIANLENILSTNTLSKGGELTMRQRNRRIIELRRLILKTVELRTGWKI